MQHNRNRLQQVTYASVLAAAVAALSACGGGDGDRGSGGASNGGSTGGGAGGGPGVANFTVGGSLSGLASNQQVVLQNNAGSDLTLSDNGAFTFTGAVAANAAYAVTVKTQPTGQVCTVTKGTGTAAAAVSDVAVICATATSPPAATANWIRDLAGACVNVPRTLDGYASTLDGRDIQDFGANLVNTQGVFFFTGNDCTGSAVFKPSTTVWNQVVRARYEYMGIPIRRVTSTAVSVGRTIEEVWWHPEPDKLCVMSDGQNSESNEQMGDLVKNFASTTGCFRRF